MQMHKSQAVTKKLDAHGTLTSRSTKVDFFSPFFFLFWRLKRNSIFYSSEKKIPSGYCQLLKILKLSAHVKFMLQET